MAGAELLVRRVFGSNSTRNFLSARVTRKESLASTMGRVSRGEAARTAEPPIPTGGAAVTCRITYMPTPAVNATAAMPAIKAFGVVAMAMAFVTVAVAVVAIVVPERAAAVETETANPMGAA